MSSARARKAPVTSGVGSRSSSIMSTDGAATSSAVSNVASSVSSTSRLVCFEFHIKLLSHEGFRSDF